MEEIINIFAAIGFFVVLNKLAPPGYLIHWAYLLLGFFFFSFFLALIAIIAFWNNGLDTLGTITAYGIPIWFLILLRISGGKEFYKPPLQRTYDSTDW
tara:strand:- start:43 stop:336 length:294 start_codon:yes stop_codon:yes gene_type:complete